jgi:hypothetical protein
MTRDRDVPIAQLIRTVRGRRGLIARLLTWSAPRKASQDMIERSERDSRRDTKRDDQRGGETGRLSS